MINDTYGHAVGDKCLTEIITRVKPALRESDFLARYGGEEFVMILPYTDTESAKLLAGRILEAVRGCSITIQEGKLEAKKENREMRDGDVQPACVQGCPSKALVFGDMNNKGTKVAKVKENPRMYNLLEELHTLASVNYLTKVRNKDAGHDDHGHDAHH